MTRVCVLLAPGFEEIEAITVIDVLRRAGIDVTVVSPGPDVVEGAHAIFVRADSTLDAAADVAWDLVVLPGGMPGSTHLRDDPGVQALLRLQHERGGRLAAICAAPIALSAAGVLEGVKATSYPGFGADLRCAEYLEDRVVVDGRVTTSRGPGTAIEFALELVRQLCDAATADELARRMLVAAQCRET